MKTTGQISKREGSKLSTAVLSNKEAVDGSRSNEDECRDVGSETPSPFCPSLKWTRYISLDNSFEVKALKNEIKKMDACSHRAKLLLYSIVSNSVGKVVTSLVLRGRPTSIQRTAQLLASTSILMSQ